MKIRDKLILSFLGIALLTGVPLWFNLEAYTRIDAGFDRAMNDQIETVKELENLKFAGIRIVSSVSEYGFIRSERAASGERGQESGEEQLIESGYRQFDAALKRYSQLAKQDNDDESTYVHSIRERGEKLKSTSGELIRLKNAGAKGEEVLEKKEAFEDDEREYLAAVDSALAFEYSELDAERKAVGESITSAANKSIAATGIVFLIALFGGMIASRRIGGRINILKQASERIAGGDLETPVPDGHSDELGALARAFGSMQESLKTTHDEITAERNFVENVLASMADAMLVLSPDFRITRVNRTACEMSGHTAEELMATPFYGLCGENGVLTMGKVGEMVEHGGLTDVEGLCQCREGLQLPVATSASAIIGASGEVEGYVLLIKDITARKELEKQLVHQALHDPLTSLANRTLFRDRLEHALTLTRRKKEPLSVLYLDLDNFKNVNDSLGHTVGDRLLVMVAERISGCLRSSDTAARLGGDEFAVLIERPTSQYNGQTVADRLINAFRRPFMIDGREVFISASIGITVPQSPDETPEELLRNSDVAMYLAKSSQKGSSVLFEPRMHTEVIRRVEMEADLRSAMAKKEFFLNYHPVIDIETGEIRGMETLIRWQHPERGIVSPLDFIPLAESTGLIVDIGRWLIREACLQGRTWHEKYFTGKPFSLMVNLSAREFQEPTLVQTISEALRESGLPPRCLVLEITESMMMTNTEAMIQKLYDLKRTGVRLALDDFGTGYSSLSYLERFPVDILKIDKSFVGKMTAEAEGVALTQAIISMSNTLHLETVAEGIELPEQLETLRDLGCALGQGFHFARPLCPEKMSEYLESAGSPAAARVPSPPAVHAGSVS